MQSTHDKLDIAYEMLDGAINALLDFKQYFVATNLAGVAEELYGYVIQFDGGTNSQKGLVDLAKVLGGADASDKLVNKSLYDASVMVKNSIKHIYSKEDRFLEVDAQDEARSAINCALTNHSLLEREFTPTIQRFYEFAREWSKAAMESGAEVQPLPIRMESP
jgi:hypothetical protein